MARLPYGQLNSENVSVENAYGKVICRQDPYSKSIGHGSWMYGNQQIRVYAFYFTNNVSDHSYTIYT